MTTLTEFLNFGTFIAAIVAGGLSFIAAVWGTGAKRAHERDRVPVPTIDPVMIRTGWTGVAVFFVLGLSAIVLPSITCGKLKEHHNEQC